MTIDTTKMKAPSFLMVLTGASKYAIRREDGVYVVPIGCLKKIKYLSAQQVNDARTTADFQPPNSCYASAHQLLGD